MNSLVNRSELIWLYGFMEAMGLVNVSVFGRKYTWFKPDGSSMSRLDRFLILEGILFA